MRNIKVEDILLMLLASGEKSRNHSDNLNLFKTLFEREVGVVNLIFNLFTGIAVAVLIGGVGVIVDNIGEDFDASFWGTIAAIIFSLGLIIVGIVWQYKRRQRVRQRYLSLIRLYYYLDALT